MLEKNWYHISNADEIDSPALLVYPQRVKANIQTAIKMSTGISMLRPHIKTHKCAEVAKLMMDAGIYKFKCATIAEAEMLAITNAKDVLLAYQPLGPKLKRFIELVKKYPLTQFSCLTDNFNSAAEQSRAFSEAGLAVSIYIDINVGMNRTGIEPGDEALKLYDYCSTAAGMLLKGIHAYDGHIRDVDLSERKKNCDAAFSLVNDMAKKMESRGWNKPVIIAGGSPTFPIHCKREDIECSPGTFVYWDRGYSVGCPEQDFVPAAVLLTRIVSLPAKEKICTDLGHKSVAAENEMTKRVYFPGFEMLEAVAQSEEHLVLENKTVDTFSQGDILYGIPWHICPTVALYDSVKVVEDDRVVDEWKNIARDRRISI
jgi:D-threonine aldolase